MICGARDCLRGCSRSKVSACTVAVLQITRGSTASTSPRSRRSWPSAAGSASTRKFSSKMGEEVGSAGLRELCVAQKHDLLRADLLIASDGPRAAPDRPTLFLGARGSHPIELVVDLREGSHHSGNWGGLLANPGIILAHALACVTDARGTIRVPEWRPPLPAAVRHVLAGVEVEGGGNGPTINRDWGEAELTPAERVFAWNSFEVLAFVTGTPERPVNAIPGQARAHCQLRYVVGTTSFQRYGATSTATVSPRLRCAAAAADFSRRVGLIPRTCGLCSPPARSSAPPAARRPFLPISVDRCPTTASPMCSACARSGSRTPMPDVRSTRLTSTCSRLSRAKGLGSWPDCSGIWARTTFRRRSLQTNSTRLRLRERRMRNVTRHSLPA